MARSVATSAAPAMRSPGAPSLRREVERQFWKQIATGITSEKAAEAVGVSQPVGTRWFRHRGGMPLFMSKPVSARQLMKMRIMQTNALRGILAEFGIAMPVGHKQLLKTIQGELARAQQLDLLPADLVISVQEQIKRIDALQSDIDSIAQRLLFMIREDRQMQAIRQIPGIGELGASALVAAVGDFSAFKSGRQFASWLGLTPRQVGTGGKTQQLGISKRGDSYLRTLLIAGARAVITRSAKSKWIELLLERRHYNVVVVALANKIARTAWAVLTRGAAFDQAKWNPAECGA